MPGSALPLPIEKFAIALGKPRRKFMRRGFLFSTSTRRVVHEDSSMLWDAAYASSPDLSAALSAAGAGGASSVASAAASFTTFPQQSTVTGTL